MLSELRTAEGGLAASLDADSDGSEGTFYVWTPAELREVLGPRTATSRPACSVSPRPGTFEHGASVLQRRNEPADAERSTGFGHPARRARGSRPAPAGTTRWSPPGMAWRSARWPRRAAVQPARPPGGRARRRQPARPRNRHLVGARLPRTSRDGVAGAAGLLEDYACVAAGLLTLSGVTGEARWAAVAGAAARHALDRSRTVTAASTTRPTDSEQLIFRPADPADNATPSGVFAVAEALLSYSRADRLGPAPGGGRGAFTVSPARRQVPAGGGLGPGRGRGLLSGPAEIAVVGPDDERTAACTGRRCTRPRPARSSPLATAPAPAGSGRWFGARWVAGCGRVGVPLLAGPRAGRGAPRRLRLPQFTCQAPVTTPEQLRAALAAPA